MCLNKCVHPSFFIEGTSNGGAIAAAVIGVFAIVAVVAGIIWWKKCKCLYVLDVYRHPAELIKAPYDIVFTS